MHQVGLWTSGTADGETKIRAAEVGLAAVFMVAALLRLGIVDAAIHTYNMEQKGHRHWGAEIFDLGQLDSLCRHGLFSPHEGILQNLFICFFSSRFIDMFRTFATVNFAADTSRCTE